MTSQRRDGRTVRAHGARTTRDERAFAISMVNRYTHRPYMNAEVLEYLQLRYIKKMSANIGTSGGAPRPSPASSPHRQTFIDLVYVRMTRILHTDTTNIATIPRVDRRANTFLHLHLEARRPRRRATRASTRPRVATRERRARRTGGSSARVLDDAGRRARVTPRHID